MHNEFPYCPYCGQDSHSISQCAEIDFESLHEDNQEDLPFTFKDSE